MGAAQFHFEHPTTGQACHRASLRFLWERGADSWMDVERGSNHKESEQAISVLSHAVQCKAMRVLWEPHEHTPAKVKLEFRKWDQA